MDDTNAHLELLRPPVRTRQARLSHLPRCSRRAFGWKGTAGRTTVLLALALLPSCAEEDEPGRGFPAPRTDIAQQTNASLAANRLGDWIVNAVAASESTIRPCDPEAVMLQPVQVRAVASLPDEVLAELILNLDGALGAAAEWCRRGVERRAVEEFQSAKTASSILERRMEQLR